MSGTCSGELLTALVDGALDHAERDRVLVHLAGCAPCRHEVEQLRALKSRLGRLAASTPAPSPGLVEQLRALSVPGADPLRVPVARPSTPVTPRPAPRPRATRPARAPSHRRARRTSLVGGSVVVGALAALLAGAPPREPASTPVDPGSDAFVVDFVSTTGGVPLADPAGAAVSLPPR
ncbi:MAG TPA: zf-HC2 domain-containing protein [Mycobacteriales bacterium]|nr:zf-HC2 domain-containing protein [Mycobacteriales bacterium]